MIFIGIIEYEFQMGDLLDEQYKYFLVYMVGFVVYYIDCCCYYCEEVLQCWLYYYQGGGCGCLEGLGFMC